jgi:hypothetical protein
MRTVTGALASPAPPSVVQQNMTFVRTHQAELAHLGVTLFVPQPVTSELARSGATLGPIPVLPPDLLAPPADHPCVITEARRTKAQTPADSDHAIVRTLALADQTAWRAGHPDPAAAARQAEIARWIGTDTLQTPNDLLRAALILEHSTTPLDLWQAHTLAWQAAFAGCGQPALRLVATTEDRFLALLGLTQRFGTLPLAIAPLDTGPLAVTARIRQAMLDTLSVEESRAHGELLYASSRLLDRFDRRESQPRAVASTTHDTTERDTTNTPQRRTVMWDAKNDKLPRPADSTLVVLTPDLVARFTTVWTIVRHDSVALTDPAARGSLPFIYRNIINLGFGTLHHFEHGRIAFPNFARLAEKYPAIDTAIQQSGLSPDTLQRIARSCLLAQYDNVLTTNFWGQPRYDTTLHLDPTTIAAKNMVFFRGHRQAIEALQLRPWRGAHTSSSDSTNSRRDSILTIGPTCHEPYDTAAILKRRVALWPPDTGHDWTNDSLRQQLLAMREQDQRVRRGGHLAPDAPSVDSANRTALREILQRYGWPGRHLVGADGAHAAYLILQHSGLEMQKEGLHLLKGAPPGTISPRDLAYLTDRVRVNQDQPQLYGTQIYQDSTGTFRIFPLEDPTHVDARRQTVGIEPLAAYLCDFARAMGETIMYTRPGGGYGH